MSGIRVDVWIWAARLAKTRSRATAACKAGHVRINGVTAKPAQHVTVGDRVRVTIGDTFKLYEVIGFASKRGSATEVAKLFTDLTPSAPSKAERAAPVLRDAGAGRPSKKERRQLDRLRGFVRGKLL
ncbi:RNA-binding S4 domain-containing protein [Canibacter sp. lx-72]|uniref:RNA-binding S4 domain-containing protein n=1 Tax=Canibacter zhuwentaonis TaxID=2837491 RepID=UPI001BDC42E7|nr:RNA-binding S4 domain-containing protein [Canibacter zhuwentaonis]MBT1018679.1 RNA-binding S4 domain-containing protein [Canibacter zhuwentaonis]